ncbi:hypothetical protein BM735_05555, partial [Erysipelotrichaceae bacterium NYU-BL-F16]
MVYRQFRFGQPVKYKEVTVEFRKEILHAWSKAFLLKAGNCTVRRSFAIEKAEQTDVVRIKFFLLPQRAVAIKSKRNQSGFEHGVCWEMAGWPGGKRRIKGKVEIIIDKGTDSSEDRIHLNMREERMEQWQTALNRVIVCLVILFIEHEHILPK